MIHKLIEPFIVFYERVCRMLFWGWNLRDSFDFDSQTIYKMLSLKYKRIHKVMMADTYTTYPKPLQRRMLIIIELANRIDADKYSSIETAAVYKKYGNPEFSGAQMIWPHLDEEKSSIVRKELSKAFVIAEEKKKRDKKMFWSLISEWNDYFWT